jgi:hypothetical protein
MQIEIMLEQLLEPLVVFPPSGLSSSDDAQDSKECLYPELHKSSRTLSHRL